MNEMGKRIRMKRTEKQLTMEQLANALGVKASAINKYEKGIVENIKRSTIQEMAKIFECDAAWLMGFDDKPEEIPEYIPEVQILVDILPRLNAKQIKSLIQTAQLFALQNGEK